MEPGLLAGAIRKLESLNVESVQLTAQQTQSILEAINEDSQLKSLDISWNDLSSVEPGLLAGAVRKMESLNVDFGQLTAQQTQSILAAVNEDSQLKSLTISRNDLSSVEPGLLTRAVTMLESLNVKGWKTDNTADRDNTSSNQ